MLCVGRCLTGNTGFPSALLGGHIEALPDYIDAAIDVCQVS
jgi:hypothetical protein